MKIEIRNILISIAISCITIIAYDYYKEHRATNKDETIVFSAKDIIEHKKLQIRKAILNNEDYTKKERELEEIIKLIDAYLLELSNHYNKPIFQREMFLVGNSKDVTAMIEAKLKAKGLL